MFIYLRPILNDRDKEGKGKVIGKVKLFEKIGSQQKHNRGRYTALFKALLLGFIQCLIHSLNQLP